MNLAIKSVKVSKDIIEKGKCRSFRKCAVALALAQQLPFDKKGRISYSVSVDGEAARYTRFNTVSKTMEKVIIALPAPVRAFIKRFDSKNDTGYSPNPIRFTTAIPFTAKA